MEPIEDSYVSQYNRSSIYGGGEILILRSFRDGANHFNTRAYMRFDLSNLPRGWKVISGRLKVYKYLEGANVAPRVIEALMVTDKWSERELTWSNQPKVAEQPLSVTVFAKADSWYMWDVTFHIRKWIEQEDSNNGFCLQDAEEDSLTDHASILISREMFELPMLRPTLEIVLYGGNLMKFEQTIIYVFVVIVSGAVFLECIRRQFKRIGKLSPSEQL